MAKAMREAVLVKKMPPWFADPHYDRFSNDRSLSRQEIDTLVAWADSGAPEGHPKDLLAPQTALIDELFRNPDFLKLWNYLKNCPAVTITLTATPGLKDKGGDERFGQYSPNKPKTLELNPTKPEHLSNPAELLDTLIHELIHALLDARDLCGEDEWPLPLGATDWYHDPHVEPPVQPQPKKDSPDSPNKRHAKIHYGDGASDPVHEYLDENDKTQEFIAKIITAVLQNTQIPLGSGI